MLGIITIQIAIVGRVQFGWCVNTERSAAKVWRPCALSLHGKLVVVPPCYVVVARLGGTEGICVLEITAIVYGGNSHRHHAHW